MEWLGWFAVGGFFLLVVIELREWLDRRAIRKYNRERKWQTLTPTKWSEDVLKYYAHTPTRRQL